MKKISTALKTIFITAALISTVAFTSCHDPIFEKINEEVPLESLGISGNITAFSRAGNYIWLTNGNLYYKTNKQSAEYFKETGRYNSQWNNVVVPGPYVSSDFTTFSTAQFVSADSSNIYILVYTWYENSDGENGIYSKEIYTTPVSSTTDPASFTAESWTKIDLSSIRGENLCGIQLTFDNQAIEDTNRKAYARIAESTSSTWKVYQLNGTSVPVEVTENGAGSSTASAVYFPKDGNTYFCDYYGMTANDKYIYFSKSSTVSSNVSGASELYYVDGWNSTTGFTTNSGEAACKALDAGGLLSLAATSNYILLGTTKGLAHVSLDPSTSVPADTASAFASGNNAGSIISEYVFKVFVLDPSLKEDSINTVEGTDEYCASYIYGSITSSSDAFDETGLYSYYPGRGTWNRDGTANVDLNGN